MSLFALIIALLLEQLKPLPARFSLNGGLTGYVDYFQQRFNSGVYDHGKTAWWLAVLPLLAAAVALYWSLHWISPILSLLFNILALYSGLGFGRYSHAITEIQLALRNGRLAEAQQKLAQLRSQPLLEMSEEETVRVAIETVLLALHRHLFGVIVWFVLFSLLGLGGAAGVLLYRLGLAMRSRWAGQLGEVDLAATSLGEARFNVFARQMCRRLDSLPIRLTAATFAIVGNFEDTVYCWRSQAVSWPDAEVGILLSSAAGASGVRLGGAVTQAGGILARPELGVGDKAGEAALHCTQRLVWRSVVLMLVVLFMLSLAGL